MHEPADPADRDARGGLVLSSLSGDVSETPEDYGRERCCYARHVGGQIFRVRQPMTGDRQSHRCKDQRHQNQGEAELVEAGRGKAYSGENSDQVENREVFNVIGKEDSRYESRRRDGSDYDRDNAPDQPR